MPKLSKEQLVMIPAGEQLLNLIIEVDDEALDIKEYIESFAEKINLYPQTLKSYLNIKTFDKFSHKFIQRVNQELKIDVKQHILSDYEQLLEYITLIDENLRIYNQSDFGLIQELERLTEKYEDLYLYTLIIKAALLDSVGNTWQAKEILSSIEQRIYKTTFTWLQERFSLEWAFILFNDTKYTEALKSLPLKPVNFKIRIEHLRALIHMLSGKYAESISIFKKLLKEKISLEQKINFISNISINYVHLNNYEKQLKTILELKISDIEDLELKAVTLNNLLSAYINNGLTNDAIAIQQQLETFIEKTSSDRQFAFIHQLYLVKLIDAEAAHKKIRHLIELNVPSKKVIKVVILPIYKMVQKDLTREILSYAKSDQDDNNRTNIEYLFFEYSLYMSEQPCFMGEYLKEDQAK